jgi:hypothetical protein
MPAKYFGKQIWNIDVAAVFVEVKQLQISSM